MIISTEEWIKFREDGQKFALEKIEELFPVEALKLYYGYSTRSEIVEKALDELIKKHSSNDVFRYYLSEARKRLKDKEVQDDSKV